MPTGSHEHVFSTSQSITGQILGDKLNAESRRKVHRDLSGIPLLLSYCFYCFRWSRVKTVHNASPRDHELGLFGDRFHPVLEYEPEHCKLNEFQEFRGERFFGGHKIQRCEK